LKFYLPKKTLSAIGNTCKDKVSSYSIVIQRKENI